MSLKIYRDTQANASVIESTADGTLGMYFNNELKAIGNGNGTCSIMNEPKSTDTIDFFEVANVSFTEFVDINGAPLGSDEASAVNAMNAIFHNTGGLSGAAPVITSSLVVNVNDVDQINYILEASNVVEIEWQGLPAGISVSGANRRNLIGQFDDGAGTYTVTVKAINYFGSVSEDIQFNVAHTYQNTKSVEFENQDWMGANAALLDDTLGRAGSGAGMADAWSIHMWIKASANNSGQTIFYFGSNDIVNSPYLELRQTNNNGLKRLRLRYGSNSNYIQITTPSGSITPGVWHHVLVTYDGGTTGSGSANLSDYYSRFNIYIDGVSQPKSTSHANYGTTSALVGQNLRVGRFASGNYMRENYKVDEVAIWGSDQGANISDLYNGGLSQDLSILSTPPDHWWRMGDGDNFPTIQDNIGNADFVMYNMTAADIVTDAPNV